MANADVHGFALTVVLSAVCLLSPAIPVEVNTEPKEVKQFSQYRGQILARAEIQIQPNVMKIVASGADCLRSNPNANHFLCISFLRFFLFFLPFLSEEPGFHLSLFPYNP